MVSAMDDGIGRVLDALDRRDLTGDTVVVFLSDNGGAQNNASRNTPLRGLQGEPVRGRHAGPLHPALAGRRRARARSTSTPSARMDIAATIVRAAGPEAIAQIRDTHPLDGVDLRPFLDGTDAGRPHDVLYWRWFHRDEGAIAPDDHKLIERAEKTRVAVCSSTSTATPASVAICSARISVARKPRASSERCSRPGTRNSSPRPTRASAPGPLGPARRTGTGCATKQRAPRASEGTPPSPMSARPTSRATDKRHPPSGAVEDFSRAVRRPPSEFLCGNEFSGCHGAPSSAQQRSAQWRWKSTTALLHSESWHPQLSARDESTGSKAGTISTNQSSPHSHAVNSIRCASMSNSSSTPSPFRSTDSGQGSAESITAAYACATCAGVSSVLL
jgi:hypothetical protein